MWTVFQPVKRLIEVSLWYRHDSVSSLQLWGPDVPWANSEWYLARLSPKVSQPNIAVTTWSFLFISLVCGFVFVAVRGDTALYSTWYLVVVILWVSCSESCLIVTLILIYMPSIWSFSYNLCINDLTNEMWIGDEEMLGASVTLWQINSLHETSWDKLSLYLMQIFDVVLDMSFLIGLKCQRLKS